MSDLDATTTPPGRTAGLQWAVTGYMLVGAAVIVTAGALGDILGRRRVFVAGLILFVASCRWYRRSARGAAGAGRSSSWPAPSTASCTS